MIQNLDILSLGIAVSSIGILGFIVFLSNIKSITNQTFLFFSLLTIFWSGFNFLIIKSNSPFLVLWLLRLSVFSAVWHAFSFFQLFYVFPEESMRFSKTYKFVLFPIVICVALFTLTPFVFLHVAEFSTEGIVTKVANGPGIVMFGVVVTALIISGLVLLVRKTIKAPPTQKVQFRYVLIGSFLTFSLLLIFNFIFPAILNNARFVPLGAVFILPFAVFTAYAVIRHHLLDIKTIATEILTFVLAVVTLVEVVLADTPVILLFRISNFVLVLIFGILLIKSVRREVEQREKLQELSKAKSEFMSIASHQLRTPLSIIKGYVSLFQGGSFGNSTSKQQEVLQKIFKTNEEMIAMVNDLLNMTRAEEGRLQYTFEKTDLRELVEIAAKSLELTAKQKNLSLEYNLPAQVVMINADKDKLTQVFSNLIDNAIKYTENGGITVSFSVDQTKKIVTVLVSDTGLGIGVEEMKHLFESFARGRAGTKLWTKGTGLGLYIAKQFVEAHGGKIWAESAGEGKGSTFHVELPIFQ